MTLVAIDIGGSGSRALMSEGRDGSARGPALSVSAGQLELGAVIDALADGLPEAPEGIAAVAIGTAGLLGLGDPAEIAARVRARWRADRIVVASDAVTGLLGAWGEQGGAIVAAGTGVVGLGTDLRGIWVRSDGWGHLLGDLGGGAWIGARGLDAALRRVDGRRGGSEPLLSAVRERHPDPAELPSAVRAAENEATFLASFAPAVVAAASAGDEVAIGILVAAAGHLAETAVSVLAPGVPERLALIGGLVAIGEPLTAPFVVAVSARRPDLELVVGSGSALEGARQLARQAADGRAVSHPPFVSVYDAELGHVA